MSDYLTCLTADLKEHLAQLDETVKLHQAIGAARAALKPAERDGAEATRQLRGDLRDIMARLDTLTNGDDPAAQARRVRAALAALGERPSARRTPARELSAA